MEMSVENLPKGRASDAPDFSVDSISIRGTLKDSFDGEQENPFNARYNEIEYTDLLNAMIEAVKLKDLETTK